MGASLWAPFPECAPVFQVFRGSDSVVKSLALSQVALHEQRAAYNVLLESTDLDRAEWERQKEELEEQLRQLTVQNAEAERLFREQMQRLSEALQSTEQALAQLDAEHRSLQRSSAADIERLTERVEDLSRTCEGLQAAKASLQEQLSSAQAHAALKDAAERRVAELEAGLAAVQARAREMLTRLAGERDAARGEASMLSGSLGATQRALAHQASLKQYHENASVSLALERQRLLAELQLERLINEPLRSTHYASTTLSHVMRSSVAPTINARSRSPLHHHATAAPQAWAAAGGPDAVSRPRSAASSATPHHQLLVGRPDMAGSVDSKALTRLGRSWATTTTTAAHPHPLYLDNVAPPLFPAVSRAHGPGLSVPAPTRSWSPLTQPMILPGATPLAGGTASPQGSTAAAAFSGNLGPDLLQGMGVGLAGVGGLPGAPPGAVAGQTQHGMLMSAYMGNVPVAAGVGVSFRQQESYEAGSGQQMSRAVNAPYEAHDEYGNHDAEDHGYDYQPQTDQMYYGRLTGSAAAGSASAPCTPLKSVWMPAGRGSASPAAAAASAASHNIIRKQAGSTASGSRRPRSAARSQPVAAALPIYPAAVLSMASPAARELVTGRRLVAGGSPKVASNVHPEAMGAWSGAGGTMRYAAGPRQA